MFIIIIYRLIKVFRKHSQFVELHIKVFIYKMQIYRHLVKKIKRAAAVIKLTNILIQSIQPNVIF